MPYIGFVGQSSKSLAIDCSFARIKRMGVQRMVIARDLSAQRVVNLQAICRSNPED